MYLQLFRRCVTTFVTTPNFCCFICKQNKGKQLLNICIVDEN
jgi:hypothetical protein